ncbi:IBR domain-containing protein [Bradyrhizobium viridifuturi]|uniref:IBR domain-containing protein n=1 Tax=Bradyrhizobium viridifuturi TaxID=1654716 RepID=UPI00067F0FBE|nr:IBR domain-containing protein [Bradyrhizobium viridifuturi]
MTEAELRRSFGEKAVDALLATLQAGEAPEIDPRLFGAKLAEAGIEVDVLSLLNAAAEDSLVTRLSVSQCPAPNCRRVIDADALANHQCPYCGCDFRELGENPVQTIIYRSSTETSRSVPWLIAIHGFNTHAAWQEEFSWRIANRFKYHAPVLIYKYGLVRVGVLFRWRHWMLARQLAQRIQKAVIHARENQIEEPPDVIIHSFGSQLFRLVLEMPAYSGLRFGRVIAWVVSFSLISTGPDLFVRVESKLCFANAEARIRQCRSHNSSSRTLVLGGGLALLILLLSTSAMKSMATRRR